VGAHRVELVSERFDVFGEVLAVGDLVAVEALVFQAGVAPASWTRVVVSQAAVVAERLAVVGADAGSGTARLLGVE
jgi:hypothetical protein